MHSTLINDVIDERKSTRTFRKAQLATTDVAKISSYISDIKNIIGPFGHQVSFELVMEDDNHKKEKIGTYGVVANPQGYILGGCTPQTTKLFDYAYVLENIVLYLTSIGIGTCWLGGRFRKQEAMSQLSLADDEIIPAITPIGYPTENPRLKERVMRTVLKAKNRKPEDQLFFYETFDQPLGERAEAFHQALHNVRVGPSAQNKQPWRLVFNADFSQVHFYITSSLANHPLYMWPPEYLDIGIAYNHFEAGLETMGITGKLVIDEPDIETPEKTSYITSWHRD